ncbi:hypothetical protein TARUN_4862 [Trichoderma arundinaceum]|uniref:Uncharacterized protein n=1 Tax=Trichoderma arundinaceum TaxID=490622 RepID=A0A395NNG3_TRIAR|nr:hypothetical protein TARUN_4862 [Trichoderma arundinaceum]
MRAPQLARWGPAATEYSCADPQVPAGAVPPHAPASVSAQVPRRGTWRYKGRGLIADGLSESTGGALVSFEAQSRKFSILACLAIHLIYRIRSAADALLRELRKCQAPRWQIDS